MSNSSEEETDVSDSELEDYVEQCLEQLISCNVKVKFSDGVYRCPYCPGKKKIVYMLKDLLQHASDVANGSLNRDIKHKGKHLSLVKYIKSHLLPVDLSSDFSVLALELPPENCVKELFVWPWLGILANVRKSSTHLKNDLTRAGFDPVRVRILPNEEDECGYAIVEFKKNWCGFHNAIMFEKQFELDHRWKKDYHTAVQSANVVYGWVARDEDYNSTGSLGQYLRKSGDLKTITDIEAEEKRKSSLLIANLSNTIEQLRMCIDELDSKCSSASKPVDVSANPKNSVT